MVFKMTDETKDIVNKLQHLSIKLKEEWCAEKRGNVYLLPCQLDAGMAAFLRAVNDVSSIREER